MRNAGCRFLQLTQRARTICDLVEDPAISLLDTVLESNRWFPIQVPTNQRVVRIPTTYTHWSVQVVIAPKFYASNTLYRSLNWGGAFTILEPFSTEGNLGKSGYAW
jgi:hypothetical protein